MTRHTALALPALLLLSSASAAPPEAPMQTVEVSANADTRRAETAMRTSVARADIARYGDSTLSAVLKRQPGISVSGDEVRMRGLGSGYTRILVNGEPVAEGFSVDSIAPSLIDRIDILRTASAELGTQGIAGTINIILRKAGGIRRDLTLGAGLRPGNANPSASLRLGDKAGTLAWSIGADLSRTVTDYDATIIETMDDAKRISAESGARTIARFVLSPRLDWKFDNGDSVAWNTILDRVRDAAFAGYTEATISGAPSSYPRNDFTISSNITTVRSDLTWTHKVGEASELLVKAGINRNRRDNDYLFRGFGATTLRRAVISDAVDNSTTLSGKYLGQLGSGHSLGLGWDGGQTERTEQRLQRDSSAAGTPLGSLDEDYRAIVNRLAVFAQDEWSVTPRLQAYLGIRWEGLRTATTGRTLARVTSSASVPSPIAQLLWKLPDSEQDQVRVALARTYKAPQVRQLVPRRYTTNNGNSPTNPDSRGNPDLRPELAWGLDAAYEHYFGKDGMVSVSAYARRIEDATVQTLLQDERGWVATPVNNGRARAAGMEIEAKLAISAKADLRANAARNWSRLDAVPGPDNRLADQTRASVNLGMDYRPVTDWTVGADLHLEFDGPVQLTSQLRSNSGPERTLDLYGLWKMTTRSQLRVSVSNALHQDRTAQSRFEAIERSTTTASHTQLRLLFETRM